MSGATPPRAQQIPRHRRWGTAGFLPSLRFLTSACGAPASYLWRPGGAPEGARGGMGPGGSPQRPSQGHRLLPGLPSAPFRGLLLLLGMALISIFYIYISNKYLLLSALHSLRRDSSRETVTDTGAALSSKAVLHSPTAQDNSSATSALRADSASGKGTAGAEKGGTGPGKGGAGEGDPHGHAPTAVCLVGAARDFEATGPSLLKRLVAAYRPCDVFLHAPLDHDSAKLWKLAEAASVAAVRIFGSTDLDEGRYPTHILRAWGSPNARQGLLQLFRLVEGCLGLVEAWEARRGFRYRMLVRARVDSFFKSRAPRLSLYDPAAFTVPFGSNFGGVNDRFGVGGRESGAVAFRRLSALSAMANFTVPRSGNSSFTWRFNSEMAFRTQLWAGGVRVRRAHVPFCVLGRRLPLAIQGACDPPVASLASQAALNGAKCLPCAPCSLPDQSGLLRRVYQAHAIPMVMGKLVGPPRVIVCNFSGTWEEGAWQRRFDRAAGPALASARQEVAGANLSTCIEKMDQLRRKAGSWDAPSPRALCLRRHLGPATRVGGRGSAFQTLLNPITESSNLVVVALNSKATGLSPWEAHMAELAPGASMSRFFGAQELESSEELATGPTRRIDLLKVNAHVVPDVRTLRRLLVRRRHTSGGTSQSEVSDPPQSEGDRRAQGGQGVHQGGEQHQHQHQHQQGGAGRGVHGQEGYTQGSPDAQGGQGIYQHQLQQEEEGYQDAHRLRWTPGDAPGGDTRGTRDAHRRKEEGGAGIPGRGGEAGGGGEPGREGYQQAHRRLWDTVDTVDTPGGGGGVPGMEGYQQAHRRLWDTVDTVDTPGGGGVVPGEGGGEGHALVPVCQLLLPLPSLRRAASPPPTTAPTTSDTSTLPPTPSTAPTSTPTYTYPNTSASAPASPSPGVHRGFQEAVYQGRCTPGAPCADAAERTESTSAAHRRSLLGAPWTLDDFLDALSEMGYTLDSCLGGQHGTRFRCTFFHPAHCLGA